MAMATKSGSKMSVARYPTNSELPLFLFTSAPKPLSTKPPTSKCQKNRQRPQIQEIQTEAACRRPHSTYNLMYDTRVRRGRYLMEVGTLADFPEYQNFEMIKTDPLRKLYQKRLENVVTPKKLLKAKSKIIKGKSMQGVPADVMEADVVNGGFNVWCQTDPYEELMGLDDVKKEQGCQTEGTADTDARKGGRGKQRAVKIGEDKDTQIESGDLWDFNKAVAPIVENISGAVLEQAFLEFMQEDELDKLRSQQRVFEVLKEAETERLRRLQERQQKMVEENAKEVVDQIKMVENAIEVGGQLSVAMFSKNYLSNVMSTTMDVARKEGMLEGPKEDTLQGLNESMASKKGTKTERAVGVKGAAAGQQEETNPIVQWMDSETNQLVLKGFIGRAILDDIIRNALVVENILENTNEANHSSQDAPNNDTDDNEDEEEGENTDMDEDGSQEDDEIANNDDDDNMDNDGDDADNDDDQEIAV